MALLDAQLTLASCPTQMLLTPSLREGEMLALNLAPSRNLLHLTRRLSVLFHFCIERARSRFAALCPKCLYGGGGGCSLSVTIARACLEQRLRGKDKRLGTRGRDPPAAYIDASVP